MSEQVTRRVPLPLIEATRLLPDIVGKRRRGYRAWDRALRLSIPGVYTGTKLVPFGSIDMLLDLDDYIERLMAYQLHGEESYALLRHLLREGDCFVDAGAHVGYYSCEAARRVRKAGKIIAIEANPATIKRLQRNLTAMAPFAPNEYHHAVLCETDGEAKTFHSSAIASWSSLSPAPDALKQGGAKAVEVPSRCLDTLAAEWGKVRLMKIDIEGAEVMAFRGARQWLQSADAPDFILCEINEAALKRLGSSGDELAALLQDLGYEGYTMSWIDAQTPAIHPLITTEKLPESADILFAKTERNTETLQHLMA